MLLVGGEQDILQEMIYFVVYLVPSRKKSVKVITILGTHITYCKLNVLVSYQWMLPDYTYGNAQNHCVEITLNHINCCLSL